jgi:hypothetical protein
LAVDGASGDFGGGVVDYVAGIAWLGDFWPARGCLRGRSVNYLYYLGIA